jgi:hypothetical protein
VVLHGGALEQWGTTGGGVARGGEVEGSRVRKERGVGADLTIATAKSEVAGHQRGVRG